MYRVEAKPKINTTNEDKQVNQDWEFIGEYNNKRQAVKIAKSKSKCKKWYELHVDYRPDPYDDPAFDAYYQNGKLEYRMF